MTSMLPFPAVVEQSQAPVAPTIEAVHEWTVLRQCAVGSDAVRLVATDAQGYLVYDWTCRIGDDIDYIERFMNAMLANKRQEKENRSARPSLSSRLRLLI